MTNKCTCIIKCALLYYSIVSDVQELYLQGNQNLQITADTFSKLDNLARLDMADTGLVQVLKLVTHQKRLLYFGDGTTANKVINNMKQVITIKRIHL